MKLSDILTIEDNPHAKKHSYGNDFFVDGQFRPIETSSAVPRRHIVISRDRHVYNNVLNLPFDDTNILLSYPDALDENTIYYALGLIRGAKKHLSSGIERLLGADFPDLSVPPFSLQMRLIYAARELTRLVTEIHELKADFYALYDTLPRHHRLDDYIHLSNIKLREIITEGKTGDDIHFEQSGLVQAIDARDRISLSKFRVHDQVEKQYLLLLSAIHNNISYSTHIHSRENVESIMDKLSQKHKILNISLQRRIESFITHQICDIVLKLSNE